MSLSSRAYTDICRKQEIPRKCESCIVGSAAHGSPTRLLQDATSPAFEIFCEIVIVERIHFPSLCDIHDQTDRFEFLWGE